MRIKLTSIFVDDQEKGLKFYTQVLGFAKKMDVPVGEYRWITVASPEEPDGVQLVLEPNANPASKEFTRSLKEQGIPLTAFAVKDVQKEYERLSGLGVKFTMPPTDMGEAPTIAVFDDTCGNLIQVYEG